MKQENKENKTFEGIKKKNRIKKSKNRIKTTGFTVCCDNCNKWVNSSKQEIMVYNVIDGDV